MCPRQHWSEDCLKLNIYAPANAKPDDNLPVLVYIHGGGYVNGNPRNWPFDHWIHQSPNVVIVSVYYRLDSIGFLSVPELANPGQGDLNAGFHDQIQALKWIQKYISTFGGDPKKVTINGESAGASSVELHLVAHESMGLFSQAIAQSVYRAPLPTPEQQRSVFEFYAERAGCAAGSVTTQLVCLRKANVSALARAQDMVTYNFTGPYKSSHPVMDGKLFTETPSISILEGNFTDVPIIVGSTSNETLLGGTNITRALNEFFPHLSQQDLKQYLQECPSNEFSSEKQRFQVATGEFELICAFRGAIIGLAAAKKNKSYTYRYNQPVPGSSSVVHASENWMMFLGTATWFNGTTTFHPQGDLDRAFASELIAYWLSFVRAGDPNKFKLDRSPVWPAYTPESRTRIVLQ